MADDVLARADAWLASDPDPDTRAELTAILAAARGGDAAATGDLRERFGPPLEFGTAGLRGLLGAGSSRMNRVVVRTVTAGLADYLLAAAAGAVSRGVVIGYDARHKSRDLAEDTARVLVGKGIPVHLAHRPWPTPVTAWLVRRTTAAAGVMVTASHNPPEYNGYKVYWGNGAQIIPPHDGGIAAAIAKVAAAGGHADLVMPELAAARADGMVKDLGEDAHEAYVAAVQALRTTGGAEKLVVAYTPLHGVGATSVEAVFEAARVGPLHVEPSQRDPDPRFPTVAFPNPEEKGAMDAVLALARGVGAELVLANDPDADRLCVAVPDPENAGAYRVLTGDQVGAVLADYMLATTPPIDRRLVATTIVSSQLLKYLAASAGADYRETLTGFKWIANAAMDWATEGGVFLMGYEEALGYTVGELVRDKDGVSAALILADLVAWNRSQGRTLLDHLADVYRRVGLFLTEQVSWTLPGAGGTAQIRAAMQRFRAAPPTELGGAAVEEIADLAAGADGLPASDVLIYRLAAGRRIIMRPSGTEPKLKSYYEVRVEVGETESLEAARSRGLADLARLRDAHQSVLRSA